MLYAVLVGVLLDDDAVLLVSVCQTSARQVVALGLGRFAVLNAADTSGTDLCERLVEKFQPAFEWIPTK